MIIKRFFVMLLAAAASVSASAEGLIDTGKSDDIIDISGQVLFGGSYVTNDYANCFGQISDLNTSMRPAWGVGAVVKFNFNNFVSLGTGLNVTFNSSRMDLAVTGREGATSISNVFLRNKYRYIDVPVFVSFGFNIASKVRWNVDAGAFYYYGIGGSQKATVYDARVNELGQLITNITNIKTHYFNDDNAFINSYRKTDIGIHLGTGLTFSRRISIGIMAHFGLKNVANTNGLIHPSCHNLNFFATVGYHF